MTRKSCPYCYCSNVNKHGLNRGRQRYRCQDCQTTWSGTTRPQRFRRKLWRQYAQEGRTIQQLADYYHKKPSFIRQELCRYEVSEHIARPRKVTVILDVTYFGSWGLLVAIDPYAVASRDENLVLYWAEILGTERTIDYDMATDTLEAMGYTIQAAVIDGRRGVRQMLERKGILVQQCQFHQLQTIAQCLTRRPRLVQNQELRSIALTLTRTTKEVFQAKLEDWHEEHGEWLKERDPLTKQFIHRRTRRAYFSLRRNLDYLFTFQDKQLLERSIRIPNTTNALDGRFGVWKTRLKSHRGCSKDRKTKILRSFFSERTD